MLREAELASKSRSRPALDAAGRLHIQSSKADDILLYHLVAVVFKLRDFTGLAILICPEFHLAPENCRVGDKSDGM